MNWEFADIVMGAHNLSKQTGVKGLKIRVAYTETERDRKEQHEEAVKRLFPDTRVKDTPAKDGYLHTVLTVPKPKHKNTS